MKESTISSDTVKVTMEMIVSMMIVDASHRDNIPVEELLYRFMISKTAEAFFDKETDMWLNGPDYLYDHYSQEKDIA